MKNLFKISLLSCVILISSCSKDDPDPVTCELTETPTTYAFTDTDGNNTVSFTGQIARLEKAKEVYDMMNADITVTAADITALIDDANSKLLTKTAEDMPQRSAIIATLNSVFDSYAASSSAFEAGTVADEGVAGIDAYGYELDARGWEADQQFAKALIGALCLQQNAYDYLTKIDLANNNVAPDGDNAYTKSEHYFDEAFGYVYGLDEDFGATASISGDNKLLLGKYLTKHDGTSDQGEDLLGNVYNAYLMGRQAIVDNCEEELNRNIEILNINLSKVVAFHAADYLRKSAEGALDPNATFHHAISEGWGFVMSLQFTKMADGMPLFSHAEVNDMLATLDAGANGAYSLRSVDGAAILNAMADQIDAAVAASK